MGVGEACTRCCPASGGRGHTLPCTESPPDHDAQILLYEKHGMIEEEMGKARGAGRWLPGTEFPRRIQTRRSLVTSRLNPLRYHLCINDNNGGERGRLPVTFAGRRDAALVRDGPAPPGRSSSIQSFRGLQQHLNIHCDCIMGALWPTSHSVRRTLLFVLLSLLRGSMYGSVRLYYRPIQPPTSLDVYQYIYQQAYHSYPAHDSGQSNRAA